MIHITQWTPDTCPSPGCVFQYSWDDAIPPALRTHTFVTAIHQCTAHATAPPQTAYLVCGSENTLKNGAVNVIMATFGTLVPDVSLVSWSYGIAPNATTPRPLSIVLPSAIAVNVNTLQTDLDAALGTGTVTAVVGTTTSTIASVH